MGTNYSNIDSYDIFQYEPFIPIYFVPKLEEGKVTESNKDSTFDNRKTSCSSESNSPTRKSTLDDGEEIKNRKKKNSDKFTELFKNLKNTPFFDSKKETILLNSNEYYLKNEENGNIRKSYYSKLIYKNIWMNGQKRKSHNNLFIFDWDNTILPTSFLDKEEIMNENNLPEEYKDIFLILEMSIINVINYALNKGDVYIITNSSIGWVEFSSNKYLNKFKYLLDKIHIISARNEYEDSFPEEPKIWKEKAFLSLKDKINDNIPTNIICFGDSIVELEAGKKLASKINNSFIKTIKLKENPEPEDLIKQLNLIFKKFDYIYSSAKNMTIRIDKK